MDLRGVEIDAFLESLILSLIGAGIGWSVALGLIGLIKEVGLQESIARGRRSLSASGDSTLLIRHQVRSACRSPPRSVGVARDFNAALPDEFWLL